MAGNGCPTSAIDTLNAADSDGIIPATMKCEAVSEKIVNPRIQTRRGIFCLAGISVGARTEALGSMMSLVRKSFSIIYTT
ncbi:hypothetical protein [uncultured Phyllobacterium sp.]|uniref:hypothetical protein n=1 Tax=uncultured Phyllobacterium sp. TaxID=253813 RepID=UPI00258FB92D|nr:hypothetical protein [uncultured Phyllobacterium sp.]